MNDHSSMAAIVIALGSNLPGDYPSSEALLDAAMEQFSQLGLKLLARSPWWRSAAWPDPTEPAFVNAVVLVDTRLPPRSVMAALLGLEAAFGRQRGAAGAPGPSTSTSSPTAAW